MKWILSVVVCWGFCEVAYSAAEEVGNVEILHKKCLVELKYQFVPSNCFRWVKVSSLDAAKKAYLQEWFSSVCQKAMRKDENQVQYHVQSIGLMSKECQKSLAEAFEEWSYKSKSEDPEKIMLLMERKKAGRDLEYKVAHDLEKTKRNRNLRSARRRLN